MRGLFRYRLWREGRIIRVGRTSNRITVDGFEEFIDENFSFPGTNFDPGQHFVGIVNNAGFSGVADSDTAASHPGWTELTSYDASTRPIVVRGAAHPVFAGSPAVDPNDLMRAEMTVQYLWTGLGSPVVLKGFFMNQGNSTKGGTTGLLWATALLNPAVTINPSDVLDVTYICYATTSN